MPGLLGSLFREFAFTLAAAVIISGFISRTLSPMMCSRMLSTREGRISRRVENVFATISGRYARVVSRLLRRRWLIVPIACGLLAIGYLAGRSITAELVPVEDPGYVFVRFQGQPGASYENMLDQAKAITGVFDTVPERQSSLILVGTPTRNEGFAFLLLKPWAERSRRANVIGRSIEPGLDRIPGVRTSVIDPNPLAGGGQAPVQFVLRTSTGYDQLAEAMDDFLKRAKEIPGLERPSWDLMLTVPRVDVEIDRALTANLKVPVAAVGETLATILGARVVSRFSWQGELYNVLVELQEPSRNELSALNEISVRSSDGNLQPLSAIVTARESVGPDALRHFGQLPAAMLSATLSPDASLGSVLSGLEKLAQTTLPPGFSYDFAGLSRQMRQANVQVGIVFLLALVFIYLFLAAQFESFRDATTVLIVVPFAVVGSLVGLAVIGGGINIYSAIGVITLTGLVAKNGIMITEFVNQRRDEGEPLREAIVAGAALRLRPILMTSIATIFGAVPLMLDSGPGSVGRSQIGAVIVGGMLLGTVVSLIVVPLVYSLVSPRVRKPLVEPPPLQATGTLAADAAR
ncbi:MAG: efflux RND transporter permease subunit [Alphaproteobacteria bacterium]